MVRLKWRQKNDIKLLEFDKRIVAYRNDWMKKFVYEI